jgi:hypothetical protein
VKFKSIKYNPKGIKREENTSPKVVLPKIDLNKNNISIISKNHYLQIKKK